MAKMKSFSLLILLVIFNIIFSVQAEEETLPRVLDNNLTQCHYSCDTCTDSSPNSCIDCSDVTRGYNGIPGYRNTCYCLGDYSESYTAVCNSKEATNTALDIIHAILLWVIFLSSLVVSAFGNQFQGMYCIDTLQTLGYSYYIDYPLPDTIHTTLYQFRYYSLSNVNTLMRSSFLVNYNISSTQTIQYVLIDQQQLSDPLYTYYEVPANFLYNGTLHLIVFFSIYVVLGLMVFLYIRYPPHKDSFFSKMYKARKTVTLRVYQFFMGDLAFFAILQCSNIIFTTPLGSMGFIVTVMVILLLWVGFAYGFYLINLNKAKFEDKENLVFFNKLKKNDKVNRNFYLMQLINKLLVVLFMVIGIGNYQLQIIAVMVVQTFFSLITIFKIKLKKKRHTIFLVLINICKIAINCFLVMFSQSTSPSFSITSGWIFKILVFVTVAVMCVFLVVELSSQFADIVTFIRQINCMDCLRPRSQSNISLEMQQCNFLSQTKSFKNSVYNYFTDEQKYEEVINEYLDQYEFEIPEDDEGEEANNLMDNENPENGEHASNDETVDNNLQNEFDPEEYFRRIDQ